MTTILNDIKYAFRQLRKNPGFTTVAVLTLALGIGANSTIFAVVNNVLFGSLPYRASDRLVAIWETNPGTGVKRAGPSGPDYFDWRQQSQSFEEMAAFDHGSGTVTGRGEPEQVAAMRVTVNFFQLLGKQALIGQTFRKDECRDGRKNVVILTHAYWQRRFDADPKVLGRTITIDRLSYEVIGVLAADFYFPVPSELFAPWDYEELHQKSRTDLGLGVFGRLRPGITVVQAETEVNTIAQRLARDDPEKNGWGVTVVPLNRALFATIRPAFWVLLGAVGFVLAIACANVANLLLARATKRRREMAIRLAVGASRWHVTRQVLAESLLLAALGSAAGLVLCFGSLNLLKGILPSQIPIPDGAVDILLQGYQIDGSVFVFTLTLCAVCGISFGLIPAFQATRVDLSESFKLGNRTGLGAGKGWARNAIVVSEIALALILLSGVGLMIQTLLHLEAVEPGFQTDHVLTMQIELPTDSVYQRDAEQAQFFRRALEEVRQVPGVRSAGLVECLPLAQDMTWRNVHIEGRAPAPPGQEDHVEYRRVSNHYFETLGIPLMLGRPFTERDDAQTPLVAVIDQTLARRYWPNDDPIGKRIFIGDGLIDSREIVGVVGGVKHFDLRQANDPLIYVPFSQRPMARMNLVVRTEPASASLERLVKEAIWRVDQNQPVYRVRTMDQIVSQALAVPRMTLKLFAGFALLALSLAAIGIYGVMTYSVAQRTNEIGIRLAMGAQKSDMLSLILWQSLRMTLLGVGIGLVGALALTRLLSSLLYEVKPTDPLTFACGSLLLLLVSLAACLLPACRATRIDPMEALRYE